MGNNRELEWDTTPERVGINWKDWTRFINLGIVSHKKCSFLILQFKGGSALPSVGENPKKLSLLPQPETVRWLGLSDPFAACPSPLPPNLRYVGVFLVLEIVLQAFIDNPPILTPPQASTTTADSYAVGNSIHQRHPSEGVRHDESLSVRDAMMSLVNHFLRAWWIPSAALISIVCIARSNIHYCSKFVTDYFDFVSEWYIWHSQC